MSSVSQISTRARQILTSGNQDITKAIQMAIDESFESGQTLPTASQSDLSDRVRAQILGLGAIEPLLLDPKIEEVWINAPDRVFVAEDGQSRLTNLSLSELEVRQLVEKMLRDSGRRLDRSEPFVDATLQDGSRLHVVIPDVTRRHWAVNIRKFPSQVYSLTELVSLGSMSLAMAGFLEREFTSGRNFLISGATQAGKTTMLCAILDSGAQTDRLVTVEETFEIRTKYLDWVALQARQSNLEGIGEISLRRLIREALRMRPTRLVIGEVRQAEALDLLIALNSGIAGLCTIHANSAAEALEKLKLLPLLAGENIPARFVEQTVNRTVDIVIHCEARPKRRIAQVLRADRDYDEVKWREVVL